MIDRSALLGALRAQLAVAEADLRERSEEPGLAWAEDLRNQYDAAREVGRTALTWSAWRDGEVALAAVAWVLAPVFVQFCADNGLTDKVFIAAPGERMLEAVDAETAFYAADPHRNSRDWLREAFGYLGGFPAAAGLVDAHNPVWSAPLGADACGEILRFWREQNADGSLVWSLTDPSWDTRFLGDLYQDLSDFAKKKYALLQTPDFVEEFILDRTLNPALEQVALEDLRLIDPTCGSGHFLLGAFERIHEAWLREAPGMDARVRAQTALQAVHGVDINPFAVAIARFRLTLAAMRACGVNRLEGAPDFKPQVAVGDSLLAGDEVAGKHEVLDFGEADPDMLLAAHRYAAEDVDDFPGILARKSYHVVVGNPPYITVKDKALNEAYRKRYLTCKGKYALTVPFMELFFELAVRGNGGPAGWVGQITSNSFMKREFGSKLIENLLSGADALNPVDLLDVIDTSGAYIPGHGTPTVILIGRRRRPTGETVHAVLGVRGEPGQPGEARKGLVWSQIVDHIDDASGFDGEYVTVTDLPREVLAAHPWSLSGGGAGDVKAAIETASTGSIAAQADSVGITCFTLEDEVYVVPRRALTTRGIPEGKRRTMVLGDGLRDWSNDPDQPGAVFPYNDRLEAEDIGSDGPVLRWMWPFRSNLSNNYMFGRVTKVQSGLRWTEYGRFTASKLRTPLSIAFAFVATHNHFVLDRGGKVFNRSAPVIKLPADATEADHLGLLGVLNSSVACFWLRQVCHGKGNGGVNEGMRGEDWEEFYEFTGTKLREFPLPESLPVAYGAILDSLAQQAAAQLPAAILTADTTPSRAALNAARAEWQRLRALMVAWQEELDWHTYRAYGLIEEALTAVEVSGEPPYPEDALPAVQLGQRAFEIVLARRLESGEESSQWFTRHGSTPVTEIPTQWPAAYRDLVQRRLDAIESNPQIRLLERPEFKRRWASESWEAMEAAALTAFIVDRLERRELWFAGGAPQVRSVAQIADAVRHDEAIQAAVELLYGRDADRVAVFTALLGEECVPFAAAWRYKPSGLVKRAEWEAVWEMQRREDAGETLDIPVPPKYGQGDFRKQSYWKHRGKLDVPKERFIAYPGAQRENDTSPVYGWAGWDHAEAAQALAALLLDRADAQGWDVERLVPLMAGLAELEPWLHQWHGDVDPDFGTSVADDITALLDERLAAAGLTRADVAAWRPPESGRGRRA